MAQEPEVHKKRPVLNMPLLKKKTMHLPILSLQTEAKALKGSKLRQTQSDRNSAERANFKQLLNLVECPEPTDNCFLMRATPHWNINCDQRETGNRSSQAIDKRTKAKDLLRTFKGHFEHSLQKIANNSKEIPKIRNLRLFIERQRTERQSSKKDTKKTSQRNHKTLQSSSLTENKVKIFPNYNCHRYISEENLERALLRKDDVSIKRARQAEIRQTANKTHQRAITTEREEYLSGWHQQKHRYNSWLHQDVPDYLQCQYFHS